MILRDYQEKAIHLLRQSLSTGHRTPMLQCSTGAGKTVIAGSIIESARNKGKCVAFIVPKITLVDQASAHLDAIGIDHGVIQADHYRTDYAKKVQVISVQTLIRRKPWEFDLALNDEAHGKFTGLLELMDKWNKIPFIGLSATPWTKGLGQHYDDLIIPITIHELIDQGHLVDADAYGPSKPDMAGVKTTGGDYNQKEAAKRADQEGLIADIVKTWLELAGNRQTICFATNVAHSKHITQRFIDAGVAAIHIDAYTDSRDRRRAIAAFKSGEVKLLSSVGVLHTGFDAPNAEVAILARPTKSLSLHIQMIGRILRPYTDEQTGYVKERGLILDHSGNIERLGFHTDPTPEHLDDGKGKTDSVDPETREEPLPKTCPQCFTIKPPQVSACPKCGYSFIKENEVVEQAGELKKLKKANRESTPEEKAEFYGGLKQYANEKVTIKNKEGWASNKFREKYGVWPNHYKDAPPVQPNPDVLGFITYCNVKWAKSKQRKSA